MQVARGIVVSRISAGDGVTTPAMTGAADGLRYLISFDAHAMDHIPDEDMPAVAKAAHEVVQEALNAAARHGRRVAEWRGALVARLRERDSASAGRDDGSDRALLVP